MKTYLINLDSDSDRFADARARLEKLNMPFERVSAVNGKDRGEAFLADFAALRPRPKGQKWGPGQMGCFLSHYHLWERIAAADDSYTLVLEDDNHLSADLPAWIADLSWIPQDADIIRLEVPNCAVKTTTSGTARGRTIYQLHSSSWCTGSYIISRRAAQWLLEQPATTHMPVDRMLFSFDDSSVANSLKIYQISPALSIQDKFAHADNKDVRFESNIESHKNAGKRPEPAYLTMVKSIAKAVLGYKDVAYKY